MSSVVQRIQPLVQTLYTIFEQRGKISVDKIPKCPPLDGFTIAHARQALTNYDALVLLLGKNGKKVLLFIEEQRRKIETALGYFDATKAKHDRQVFAALGGTVVALRAIPTKITPLVRSITASIKVRLSFQLFFFSFRKPPLRKRSLFSLNMV
jgi:TATA-binding protein-associated factor